MKPLFILIIALSFTLTVFGQQDSTISAVHYKTQHFDCAIFPSSSWALVFGQKRFTPNKQDIDTAETALKVQLQCLNTPQINQGGDCPVIHKNLRKYSRQYFGYVDSAGHRILYINCVWKSDDSYKNFTKSFIDVMDGCSFYWHVRFDLDAHKLFDLYVNGRA